MSKTDEDSLVGFAKESMQCIAELEIFIKSLFDVLDMQVDYNIVMQDVQTGASTLVSSVSDLHEKDASGYWMKIAASVLADDVAASGQRMH